MERPKWNKYNALVLFLLLAWVVVAAIINGALVYSAYGFWIELSMVILLAVGIIITKWRGQNAVQKHNN